jgi:hypothetical protein
MTAKSNLSHLSVGPNSYPPPVTYPSVWSGPIRTDEIFDSNYTFYPMGVREEQLDAVSPHPPHLSSPSTPVSPYSLTLPSFTVQGVLYYLLLHALIAPTYNHGICADHPTFPTISRNIRRPKFQSGPVRLLLFSPSLSRTHL